MESIAIYLNHAHQRCDELCMQASAHVGGNRWDDAELLFQAFSTALEQHFTMEEKVLFSAFEKAIRTSEGPTSVMREEHRKIRSVIFMLQDALTRRARNAFLGHADTLTIMIAQHNLVEQTFLYPMMDSLPESQQNEIRCSMSTIAGNMSFG